MNTVIGDYYHPEVMFKTIGGWTSQFNFNGIMVGGNRPDLENDPRVHWQLAQIGGIKNQTILELGALEAAHTKMFIEAGARKVIAIEGQSDCWLRCLVVKAAFDLNNAHFIFADFNDYVGHSNVKFDMVSAAGILYHQLNPAKLIHGISRITDRVIVWSQTATETQPSLLEGACVCNGIMYNGKIHNYLGGRLISPVFTGGLNETSMWLYRDELLKCFRDAGFTNIIVNEEMSMNNGAGGTILFVAMKSST